METTTTVTDNTITTTKTENTIITITRIATTMAIIITQLTGNNLLCKTTVVTL
jgi:hypothetical protein